MVYESLSRIQTKFGALSEKQQKGLVQFSALLIFIVLWELTGQILGSILFAPLSEVIPTYIDLAVNGPMYTSLVDTMREAFIGFTLAVIFAVPVGLLMGRTIAGEGFFNPFVSALLVTSTSSMLPLLLVLFGIGFKLRIVVVWIASVAHITINIYHGARGIDEEYVDVGRSFGASRWLRIRSIALPAAFPYIMAGLRMGIGRAIQGIILIETYILTGYGGLLYRYGSQSVTTESILAFIITIMVLAYTFRIGLEKLQERIAPWANTNPAL